MLFANEKLTKKLSWTIFILVAIQVAKSFSIFTDVPPPPVRPARFESREELKRYLQLVHEYYAIIGRPRFGRSVLIDEFSPKNPSLFNSSPNNDEQSKLFDILQEHIYNK